MNQNILRPSRFLPVLIAGIALATGLPNLANGGSYETPPIKQLKVKDHKVKVKVVGGKAKIKTKANGKEKVKIKGPNGPLAAQIASNARATQPTPDPYYGK